MERRDLLRDGALQKEEPGRWTRLKAPVSTSCRGCGCMAILHTEGGQDHELLSRCDDTNRSVFVLYAARYGGTGRASDA